MTALTPLATAQGSRFNDARTWLAFGAAWSSAEQKTLECCAIRVETADVKTFVFRCPDFVALAFEPGQFITLSLTIDGQRLSRCYTLSSTPTRPFSLAITVKCVPGGPVSNWLHDHLEVGSRLQASGPAGIFTPVGHPVRRLLYLSAGSGVTPLMAMTRAAFDLGSDPDIAFVHSARTPRDIIFRDELAHLQATQPGLRVFAICEAPGAEADWQGALGRLDLPLLERLVPDFREREVFICGPQGYMDAVQRTLQEGGFDLAHFHQESFTIGSPAAPRRNRADRGRRGPVHRHPGPLGQGVQHGGRPDCAQRRQARGRHRALLLRARPLRYLQDGPARRPGGDAACRWHSPARDRPRVATAVLQQAHVQSGARPLAASVP